MISRKVEENEDTETEKLVDERGMKNDRQIEDSL